ncbi:N-acetylmuramoyl-L-alanine amidase [Clostridiaceae bacterium NSJ-31]|uniref:N-acetylmuramoyl-L-alanine amidase n=1 Tax=Ligaoa zhengdingensis TaxID=2763658 RepID=A0A926DXN3_9FIRM|nr:N-acetylmuramoyl-L-alanine amidase [Ligaoa zhengdingensis]MBC8545497.1 N-acetylmuramoyl-L-alanine amidase [Ligaoa zhengdingensis]
MKQISKRLCALFLTMTLLLSALPVSAWAAPPQPLDFTADGQVNGLYVSTAHGRDFPSRPGLSHKEQKRELDEIVAFAAQYGFSHIFFEAVSNAGAFYRSKHYAKSEVLGHSGFSLFGWGEFDPLAYLTEQAEKLNLSVVAVIDPFVVSDTGMLPDNKKNVAVKNSEHLRSVGGKLYFNPTEPFTRELTVAAATELAKNYPLSGIALQNFNYPTEDFELTTTPEEKKQLLTGLLTDLRTAMSAQAPTLKLGLFPQGLPGSAAFDGCADLAGWADQKLVDFIVPSLSAQVDGGDYAEELTGWSEFATNHGVALYTGNAAERVLSPLADLAYYDNPQELNLQLYVNNQIGADGCVISRYGAIKDNFFDVATNLAAAFTPGLTEEDTSYPVFELSIPQEFNITRPTQEISTSYQTYYIMGTSDPAGPVTLDGEPVAQAPGGAFGTLVSLKLGANSFTFRQGDQVQTVVINRYDPNAVAPSRIGDLRSIYPQWEQGVRVGEELTLSCVAPSGASVSVQLEGRTIFLTQAAAASPGVPATFTADATLTGDYPADETTRLGPLTYAMSYNGQNSSYTSNGELSAVGKNANFAIEVTDMRGDTSSVNLTSDFRDNMITSVEQGATDYVVGQSSSYYQLSCGGYIHKEDVRVLDGKADIDVTVGGVAFETDGIGETFVLAAEGKPYYISQYNENTVDITFYNTAWQPAQEIGSLPTELFDKVTAEYDSAANTTTLHFETAGGKRLWGYNVEFGDGKILVRAKRTPKLSQNPAKPLEGVTIVVDAGHGGNDPGALGVAGLTGPDERNLNYMNAYAAYLQLRALGATVYMTQTNDERLSYEQRMDIARDTRADFYLSFHLNSTAESTDSTNAKGIEIYYNEELAIPLGEAILSEVCRSTGRRSRGVFAATFRVTQMTHTPSLLCEMGYMVSPEEYEQLCDPQYIYRVALGVSSGILKAIRNADASTAQPQAAE